MRTRQLRVAQAQALFDQGLTSRRDPDNQRDGLDQLQANLLEIDIRLAQADRDLASARAALEQNQIDLLEVTSKEAFDLEDRIKMLALQADALRARQEDLKIRAPGSGIIHAVGYIPNNFLYAAVSPTRAGVIAQAIRPNATNQS